MDTWIRKCTPKSTQLVPDQEVFMDYEKCMSRVDLTHCLRYPIRSDLYIVSSIGTYTYEPAKYLCAILQPYISDNHCTQDSFTFVNEIKDIPLSGNFMVSFDVESLLTNIPLDECIDLAVRYIKEGNTDIKLSATELKTLLRFATAQTHFLCKGSFYDQVDGVSMGSSLAPVLASLSWGITRRTG